MAYINYNPNPNGNRVGDCVVRALSKVLDYDWEKAYVELAMQGFIMKDMPSSNHVWGSYLISKGFKKYMIPNECPDCYTVIDFCKDYPEGVYVLATGGHAIAVVDGDYYDSFDSGDEVVTFYFVYEGGDKS